MMHLLALALLLAEPDGGRPGQFDPPVLIDVKGGKITLTPGDPLKLGTTCLTFEKAESVRDDLAEKNRRGEALEAALLKTDPAPLKVALFTIAGILVGGAVAAGAICGTGHCR